MVEKIKELLEKNYSKKLTELGIQQKTPEFIPLENLIEHELLEGKEERINFEIVRNNINQLIITEKEMK